MDVTGRAALITGGGTGVGRATALALARRGCAVAVNYSRSRDEAERTAADARALGVPAVALRADVAEDGECRELVAAALAELGRLDLLVQSAGRTVFVPHGDLEKLDAQAWDAVMAVNVRGPFQCARRWRRRAARS